MNLKVYKKILFVTLIGTNLITTPKIGNITYAKEIVEQNDETFLDYLDDLKRETIEYLNSEEVLKNKEKIIDNFIKVVDFIYFDDEINGIKFDELKDSTKEEVYEVLSILDEKIENKFPKYKDNLEVKYTKIKDTIINKIDDINKKLKKNETYNNVKDKVIEGVNEFKDISKEEYDETKKYVKKWYFNLKEKH